MRYVIFSRISTKQQVDESQLFECRKYIESVRKEGDEVIEFREGVNSTRLTMDKRPVLMEMLEFLKKGDTLVVFCLSRIARTGSEIVKIYEDNITIKKALLHSIQEPKVDKTYVHLYAMFGEITRDIISTNTKAGLKSKQAAMEKVGTCWYGYKTDETKKQKRENVKSTDKPYLLIPAEDEQMQVNLMVKLHHQGLSYGEISHELERLGFRNRKGNPVYKSTVFRVLRRLKRQCPTPMAAISV